MTRTFKTLVTVSLGAFLLTSASCEDKESQEALKTCKNDMSNVQKSLANQTVTVNNLKAQLAQAEAKVQELAKENAAKPEAKKDEPAKAEKKAGKAKK